jgi:hypothetical protein
MVVFYFSIPHQLVLCLPVKPYIQYAVTVYMANFFAQEVELQPPVFV